MKAPNAKSETAIFARIKTWFRSTRMGMPITPTDFAPMVERGKQLAARVGISDADLKAIRLGGFEKYLILIPIMERLLDRIEALEKHDGE